MPRVPYDREVRLSNRHILAIKDLIAMWRDQQGWPVSDQRRREARVNLAPRTPEEFDELDARLDDEVMARFRAADEEPG